VQVFQKSRNLLKILSVRRVPCSKFHTQDPHILGTIILNLAPLATGTFAPLIEGLKEIIFVLFL